MVKKYENDFKVMIVELLKSGRRASDEITLISEKGLSEETYTKKENAQLINVNRDNKLVE